MRTLGKTFGVAIILPLVFVIVAAQRIPAASAAEIGAKAIFDVRTGQPLSAANNLKLIHQTYKDLKADGKTPEFAVVFIGPSVKLISTSRQGFAGDELKSVDDIAKTVAAMSKDGIRLEICMFAANVFHVDPASVLPDIHKVPNGWLSLIDYQAKGYALVPAY